VIAVAIVIVIAVAIVAVIAVAIVAVIAVAIVAVIAVAIVAAIVAVIVAAIVAAIVIAVAIVILQHAQTDVAQMEVVSIIQSVYSVHYVIQKVERVRLLVYQSHAQEMFHHAPILVQTISMPICVKTPVILVAPNNNHKL
jgi:hypothetical protein